MAELWFVGVGLDDERGLSARGREAVLAATSCFAEEYTASLAPDSFGRMARSIGRPIRVLGRAEVESGEPILDALGAGGPVVFLVPGDAFAATTHVALRLRCEERGHTWRYLPNASILSAAAGLLGLMHYRFGGAVSLPFPAVGFAPTSPLERIARNRSVDLHTLVLLDLRPEERRFMSAHDALQLLEERDPDHRRIPPGIAIAVVARVGSEQAAAWVGPVDQLRTIDFGPPMHALVVPAPTLHFEEEAALRRFRVS